jgi:hypothetical protein
MYPCEAQAMKDQLQRIQEQCGEIAVPSHQLLDEVRTFIKRFCAFPDEHCLAAVTLWAAHAHMVEYFHTTPRLALISPEPASGKTRVLEVLDLIVPAPMFAFNASAPTVYRKLKQQQVTLLFDEVDTIWGCKGQDDNESLRALLNAGYKQGAVVPRCVGSSHDVEDFPVFCAVALAGIGELPDTIMTRSVIIKMRRRGPTEKVENFRPRRHDAEGHALRERIADWAADVGQTAGEAWPTMPSGVVDRNEEIWEPLIAVADQAGGHWPDTAREACVAMCKAAEDRRVSLGIRLLGDLRTIFGDSDKLSTAYIIETLVSPNSGLDDDAPWAEIKGKGNAIDSRKLAQLLKRYGVKSQKVRIHEATLRGYRREHLDDAWQRYLPPVPAEAEQVEHPDQISHDAASKCSGNIVDTPPSGTQVEHGNRLTAGDVLDVPLVPDTEGDESDIGGIDI